MGNFIGRLFESKETQETTIEDVARLLHSAKNTLVLTGAGVSAESGIPTFRNPGDGLWARYDPAVYATIWGFDRHPEKIWELCRDFLKENDPKPNPGHVAIAELEALGAVQALVTQNVDNLHQDAGSSRCIEFHGNLMECKCRKCGAPGGSCIPYIQRAQAGELALPPRCPRPGCGGPMKPSAVLFGESIPPDAARSAMAAAAEADLVLVIGTSANVTPAADIPRVAARAGAKVVEINLEPTGLTGRVSDVILKGRSGEVLPKVVNELRRLRGEKQPS